MEGMRALLQELNTLMVKEFDRISPPLYANLLLPLQFVLRD
jgi:hypothetical protein